jgi:hypothetical protein
MSTRVLLVAVAMACAGPAFAQVQIKSRVMVVVDTSGSMLDHFGDNNGCGGDGNAQSRYTDINVVNRNYYPGTLINGVPDGANSRLFGAKSALFNVVNSTGDIDFGLMRYHMNAGNCPNAQNCCTFAAPACVTDNAYIDFNHHINWSGDCGPSANGMITDGGQVLVLPTQANSNSLVEAWVDNVEDFRAGGVNGGPLNPELRASGSTPLAGVVRTAMNSWYQPIFAASNGGNCNPQNTPLCDTQINCRPYALVVMTDGADTCDGDTVNGPPNAVTALSNVNKNNPVQTYAIGLAFMNGDPAIGVLNNMAMNGGTGQAAFANNQAQIEAAFADILAASVKYEQCNGKDDNCNTFIDEGLGVYQECTAANQCASGTCNAGRCTCANNGQCANGFLCAAGFCVPSCSVGVGACTRTGVKKCSGMGNACCVNDGQAACAPLMPGAPGVEVCNGIDDNCNGLIDENGVCGKCTPTAETCDGKDNDCDGVTDNNLVDIGKTCGLNIGICMPGTTECINMANADVGKGAMPDGTDHLICAGGVQPKAPQCNGCDNDCDGVRDSATQNCYSGPNGTNGVGICHGGTQTCTANMCPQAAQFGPCVGEVDPQKEICNGVDDDCNGKIDDVMGANVACCPSGKCGVGICTAGLEQCSGGALACIGGTGPQPEVCNGLDDDCNGKTDDLPGIGNPCVPNGGCQGMLVCDVNKQMIVCMSNGNKNPEICNGIDDDCNGIIDDPNEVAMNDNRVGKPCGNPQMLPPPCQAGTTICKNGMIVCDGAVGPMMEVCDGLDNDCDGMTDDMAPCPSQFVCYNANCDPLCQMGEFPCPGGYTAVMYMGQCICVADKNCMPACTNGQVCDTQTGTCVDPCANVNCPKGQMCEGGSCYGCEKFGCGNCQRCDKASHQCVADKCCNVNCTNGQYCDPTSGMCVATCAMGCPTGQICSNGNCVNDPCAGKNCPEAQACDPKTGNCVQDTCLQITCGPNLACCSGQCVADPCMGVTCPNGTVCKVSSLSCQTSCDVPPVTEPKNKDQIVGAGGGGFACSVATRKSPTANGLALLALWMLGAAAARLRARGRMKRSPNTRAREAR